MTTLYLCGAGNPEGVRLALAINRKQARWDRIILLDDDPAKHGQSLLGVKVAGPFRMLEQVDAHSTEVANLVTRTPARRWLARRKIEAFHLPLATLIHPSVDTSGVELGEDLIVFQNATVGPLVSLGDGCVIFMGAVVGHESQLGRGCIVAANAVVNGRVRLGAGVHVGTNATIFPELRVGAGATIGAGSVAIQDVPARATVLGVPGKIVWINPKPSMPESESLPKTLEYQYP